MNQTAVTYPTGKYNPAGITKVYYCDPDDILTFPVLDTPESVGATFSTLVTMATAIVMKVGKQFYELYCTLEEGEIKSTVVGPRDGKGKENSLSISFPGNDAGYLGYEAYSLNRPQIFLVREKNGKWRVLGSPDDPAYVDAGDSTSGKKIADGRANTLTFKASAATAPPLYTTAVALLLAPAVAP